MLKVEELKRDSSREYGNLPKELVHAWATKQAELSEQYQKDKTKGVSATPAGRRRKEEMLQRVYETLSQRSNMGWKEILQRMADLEERLEDPGLLDNFEVFRIPDSDFMLPFYFAVWDRRIAEVMCYTHNICKDLKGVMRKVPEDDAWYQMSYFEGMNINERKKSHSIADFIYAHDIKHATSFGGGDIPEKFYDLPRNLKLTVFDNGPVSPLEELFPDKAVRKNVNYIHESFAAAPTHKELLNTQQLVWMHGLSMYLNEAEKQEMTGAILCGLSLLKPDGYMKYDYLIWMESIRRVVRTQGWPYDPEHPMVIFKDVSSAIEQGRKTIEEVNKKLGGKAEAVILDPEITFAEPWGATSVRFTIQKRICN